MGGGEPLGTNYVLWLWHLPPLEQVVTYSGRLDSAGLGMEQAISASGALAVSHPKPLFC